MDQNTIDRRLEVFEQRCREERMPFTVQRRVILEAALKHGDHPTADEVHDAVVARIPGVSRTTVYRTLETLVRMGLITKVSHRENVVRYETRLEPHHHLVCVQCESILDFTDAALDALPFPDTSRLGFEISDFGVQFRGICRRCRDREDGA